MKRFKEKGHLVREDVLTIDEAKDVILDYLRRKDNA
jgi:energy-coupling factor transport system ATP-binding protein